MRELEKKAALASSLMITFSVIAVSQIMLPAVCSAGLIYRWSFENDDLSYEGSGAGTPTSAGTVSYVDSAKPGFGRAASFSDSGTFFLTETTNGLGLNYDSFSVSMHLKLPSVLGWDDAISIGDNSGGWRSIVMEITGTVPPGRIATYNIDDASGVVGGTTGAINGTDVSDGAWHHLGMTSDGTTFRLYLDGVEVGTSSFSSSEQIEGIQVMSRLGADVRALTGEADEVHIYDHVLTAADMLTLATAPTLDPPQPDILSVTRDAEGGIVNVTFISKPGKTYRIDGTTDLKTWDELNDFFPASTGSTTTYPSDEGIPLPPHVFYRVRVSTPSP